MRPHALAPIDPAWVRQNMGRPRSARVLMARSTGARSEIVAADALWPGGERVWSPFSAGVNARDASAPKSEVARDAARRDPDAMTPVVLYLHGGGYIACSPETHRPLVSSLVRRLGGEAWVPRYRLAPEHRYPAALDDGVQAYRHLVEARGIPASRIVIAGDSAGGGLALAVTMRLRDEAIALPSSVVMFSPWTDLATTGGSLDENSDRCAMFAGDTIRRAAQFYVGDADPTHPYVSPLYGDFRGLPPLLLHASHDEVLRDDSIRVATRARNAGVATTLQLWHRVPHVWQFFAAVLPEARASLAGTTHFVHDALATAAARALPVRPSEVSNDDCPSRDES